MVDTIPGCRRRVLVVLLGRRFREYPLETREEARTYVASLAQAYASDGGGSKGHVKAQKVASKEKQAPRPPLHRRRGRRGNTPEVKEEVEVDGLAVGAAARRVLCNQSCFGASESTKAWPLTDQHGVACASAIGCCVRPPSPYHRVSPRSVLCVCNIPAVNVCVRGPTDVGDRSTWRASRIPFVVVFKGQVIAGPTYEPGLETTLSLTVSACALTLPATAAEQTNERASERGGVGGVRYRYCRIAPRRTLRPYTIHDRSQPTRLAVSRTARTRVRRRSVSATAGDRSVGLCWLGH